MGSYTGRDLNSLNCYINRKFKGLCGAVKARKGPCAGQASGRPSGVKAAAGLSQQPTLSLVSLGLAGEEGPALQTKVNCSSSRPAWPMQGSSLAATAGSVHTGLPGPP